jgi:hypothetical protein
LGNTYINSPSNHKPITVYQPTLQTSNNTTILWETIISTHLPLTNYHVVHHHHLIPTFQQYIYQESTIHSSQFPTRIQEFNQQLHQLILQPSVFKTINKLVFPNKQTKRYNQLNILLYYPTKQRSFQPTSEPISAPTTTKSELLFHHNQLDFQQNNQSFNRSKDQPINRPYTRQC